MCGIAGVLRPNGETDDRATVEAMLVTLRRRGPDCEGIEREGPLTVGHRRLAVVDLSDAARQPMRSHSGRLLVTYNGEIYNFRELRKELGLTERDLRSRSDTEVLLAAWERWGPAALDRMVGQWAFAIYDRDSRRLWLARDRFGEKPLYYHTAPGSLSFASSIPALLKAPWVGRDLDPEALAEYLTLRYVISPRTVVSGILKLPAGHLLTVGPEGTELRQWYDPRFVPDAEPPTLSCRRDLVDRFGALLLQAAERCLVSDLPVGLLLSDGIDSNSLRSALRLARHEVRCFTYRVGEPGGTHAAAALEAKETAGRTEIWSAPSERLGTLVPAFSSFTEPTGDGAALALWYLIRQARPSAGVFLSGSGGDEILGGYRLDQDLLRLRALRRFSWLPEPLLRKVLLRYLAGSESTADRRTALRRSCPESVPALARYLVNRPLPLTSLAPLFGPGAVPGRYLGSVDRLYDECDRKASGLDRVQEVMLRTFLTENILSHTDSVAMASSAELRLPFLDRDLVDFVLRLPASMRVGGLFRRPRTKRILNLWREERSPGFACSPKKRTFNYGSIRQLLPEKGGVVRDLILDARALRRLLPGLDAWVGAPPAAFRGPVEGTLWALLSLGIWCEAAGIF